MTRIGMVCEASADQITATIIASKVAERAIVTVGLEANVTFVNWTDLNKHPQTWPKYHLHGFKGGPPLHGSTLEGRKALLLFGTSVDAVILMKDGDDEADDRRAALVRARDDHMYPLARERVVIAVPAPEREAWYICGFEPTAAEEEALRRVKADLGYDPRFQSHQLKHGRDQAKTNAKRILDTLTGDDRNREMACLNNSTVEILHDRGEENGLRQYIVEIRQYLMPMLQNP